MRFKFNTPAGAALVVTQRERPSSFIPYASRDGKTLVIYPHGESDFGADLIDSGGSVLVAPNESALLASAFFLQRGLPARSLSLLACGEEFCIPDVCVKRANDVVFCIKCQELSTNSVDLFGGMRHILYTCGRINRARIIEAPSEINLSEELLRRIKVVGGLPDAVRSLAYRRADGCYRMASSDHTLTLDSVLPLVSLAHKQGVVGTVEVICRGLHFEFYIPSRYCGEAYVSSSGFFSELT